jgi:hypothetical protein
LDRQILEREIVDYDVFFESSLSSDWFYHTVNTLWLDVIQELEFDSKLSSWTLSTTSTILWESYEITLYSWIKFVQQSIIDSTQNLHSFFSWNNEFRVEWSLWWAYLNSLFIYYYDENRKITLSSIRDITGFTLYSTLRIRNEFWKKTFYWNWVKILPPVLFYFERNWVEKIISIN